MDVWEVCVALGKFPHEVEAIPADEYDLIIECMVEKNKRESDAIKKAQKKNNKGTHVPPQHLRRRGEQ